MTIPSYGEKNYWEHRYAVTECAPFEWYGGWHTVKPFLHHIQCKTDVEVLHIGCGSSTLAEDMHENGYRNNQFCVDFVGSVVEKMQKRSAESRPEIKYATMDITDSAFSSHIDSSFQLVIDKVGRSLFFISSVLQSLIRLAHRLPFAGFVLHHNNKQKNAFILRVAWTP